MYKRQVFQPHRYTRTKILQNEFVKILVPSEDRGGLINKWRKFLNTHLLTNTITSEEYDARKEEILEAKNVDIKSLPDPMNDNDRVQKDEWLVLVGVCTHLGCVPVGSQGEYDGWFCPCHGSHYDTSGRIRKGPAPKNLEVPPYEYISDTIIRVG